MEQQEYTLMQYCTYVVRKWLVVLIVAIVGLVAGVVAGITTAPDYTVELYEGYLSFSPEQYYANATAGKTDIVEGDQNIYTAQLASIVALCADDSIDKAVYEQFKDRYVNVAATNKAAKEKEFFTNFDGTADGNYRVKIVFAYRIKNADDVAFVKEVITAYQNAAMDLANAQSSSLTGVMRADEIFVQHDTAKIEWLERTEKSSTVISLIKGGALGLVIGAAVGVVVTLIVCLFDGKLKSARVQLPDGKKTVLYAGKGGLSADAAIKLAGVIATDGYKKVLLAVLNDMDTESYVAAISDQLAKYGVENVQIEAYAAANGNELAYKARRAEAVAIVANQSKIKAASLVNAIGEASEGDAKYLGAVLCGVGTSYLD